MPVQQPSGGPGLLLAFRSQRQIGAGSVLSGPAPLGLAMPDEPQFAARSHEVSCSLSHLGPVCGTTPSPRALYFMTAEADIPWDCATFSPSNSLTLSSGPNRKTACSPIDTPCRTWRSRMAAS